MDYTRYNPVDNSLIQASQRDERSLTNILQSSIVYYIAPGSTCKYDSSPTSFV